MRWHDRVAYAALGDSYSAGETGDDDGYVPGYDDQPKCHRHEAAYPSLLRVVGATGAAESEAVSFDFLACTGGRTYNVVRDLDDLAGAGEISDGERQPKESRGPAPSIGTTRQNLSLAEIQALRDVDLVTMTIGGNDAKWADVLAECFFEASEQSANDCFDGINKFPGTQTPLNEWVDHRLGVVVARVEATVRDIRLTAPNATVVMVGYPQLTPGLDEEQRCGKFDPPFAGRKKITPTEQNKFRAYAVQLEAQLEAVAIQLGVHYVPVAEAFAGHEVCGNGGEWKIGRASCRERV